LGKNDLAQLHLQAIDDFKQRVSGKKNIQLPYKIESIDAISPVFDDPDVKRIIIPWTVNLQATSLQTVIVKVMKKRSDLKVYYFIPPRILSLPQCQLPGAIPISLPGFFVFRYLKYFRLRMQFDLALQSDYQPILPLSWIAENNLFLNYENFCLRPKPNLKNIISKIPLLIKKWR
jgi:hypothetical protein